MEGLTFFQTEMGKELLIAKIRASESLKMVFTQKKYITEKIDRDLDQRLNGFIDNHYTMLITGTTGTQKSSLAQTIAKNNDPSFKASRVKFDYEKFRENVKNSNPKETNILDESVFTHGAGANRLVQEIQNLIETLRQRQNPLIITCVENKYFSENIFTYVLETIDTCIKATCPHNPELHEPRNCTCWQEKTSKVKECYVRAVVKQQGLYIGFYVAKIDWANQIWQEYQYEKVKFMESIKGNEARNMDYAQTAREVMADLQFPLYKKTKRSIKLLINQKRPNLTLEELENIAEQIRVFQRGELLEEKHEEGEIDLT